jgi:hypothetical protein
VSKENSCLLNAIYHLSSHVGHNLFYLYGSVMSLHFTFEKSGYNGLSCLLLSIDPKCVVIELANQKVMTFKNEIVMAFEFF